MKHLRCGLIRERGANELSVSRVAMLLLQQGGPGSRELTSGIKKKKGLHCAGSLIFAAGRARARALYRHFILLRPIAAVKHYMYLLCPAAATHPAHESRPDFGEIVVIIALTVYTQHWPFINIARACVVCACVFLFPFFFYFSPFSSYSFVQLHNIMSREIYTTTTTSMHALVVFFS